MKAVSALLKANTPLIKLNLSGDNQIRIKTSKKDRNGVMTMNRMLYHG